MASKVASVVGLIKTLTAIKGISPPPIPDNAVRPYVTVHKVSSRELESLAGRSGLLFSIMQVNVWHEDYEKADSVREQIKDLLLPYVGSAKGNIVASVNHLLDAELYDGPRKLHQAITRFKINWEAP